MYSEKHFLDEKIMLSKSDFPIKPAELVEKCKVRLDDTKLIIAKLSQAKQSFSVSFG